MATVVTPQLTNHFAILSKSSVKVENTRTGCSSRSGGTATKISLAPILITSEVDPSMGRPPRHIPFRFWPRLPLPAVVVLATGFRKCFFAWDMPVYPFGSGRGQVAQIKVLFRRESAWDAAADCNHGLAHGTWDHARQRV